MTDRRSSVLRPFASLARGLAVMGLLLAAVLAFASVRAYAEGDHKPRTAIKRAARTPLFLLPAALVVMVGLPFTLTSFAASRGRYRIGPTELEARTGLLTKATNTLRYADIEGVELESGPLLRLLGRSDLTVRTTRGWGGLTLYGIDGAEELRAYLLERRDSLCELARGEQAGDERLIRVLERLEKKLPPTGA